MDMQVDIQMDGQTDGHAGGHTDGWTDRHMTYCCYVTWQLMCSSMSSLEGSKKKLRM